MQEAIANYLHANGIQTWQVGLVALAGVLAASAAIVHYVYYNDKAAQKEQELPHHPSTSF